MVGVAGAAGGTTAAGGRSGSVGIDPKGRVTQGWPFRDQSGATGTRTSSG